MAFAQESKADKLFFGYNYAEAIAEYKEEAQKNALTHGQQLNLADAYFKTKNYPKALEGYIEVNKADSIMTDLHFNRMFRAMQKTGNTERIAAFIATLPSFSKSEWIENYDFNRELMTAEGQTELDYKLFNLDNNSPNTDFSPTFYEDKLLFSSGRPQEKREQYGPAQEAYLDVFVAKVGANGNMLGAQPFTGLAQTAHHRSTPFYCNATQEFFYILSNEEEGELLFDDTGKNALAIGKSGADGDFQILLRDLSTSFYYPYFDAEKGNLYFAANFEGMGYGGTDIYYVRVNEGRIMTAPRNLGPRINSPGNEIAPYLFEGSLYFASDIFYGYGGMDIYKSNIQENETYSTPINLGKGINSEEDDFGFIIKNFGEQSLLGYLASNRKGGKGKDDIYGFKVDEKPGIKTLLVQGNVNREKDQSGIEKAHIKIFDVKGNLLRETYTQANGTFQMEMPWQDVVEISVGKQGFSSQKGYFEKKDFGKQNNLLFQPTLTALEDMVHMKEKQTVVKMDPFFFNRGSSSLTPEITTQLDKAVKVAKLFQEVQLRIETHTDSRGGSSSNHRISQSRANAIKAYMIKNGVPASNILYAIGYGEDKLLNNCSNGVYCIEMMHQKNDRSLVVILNYDLLC
jgi:outer membrane protein OmpA-like peptidoglycan-associated protein